MRLSSLGVFKLIVHRDFPLDRVERVVVKLTRSGKVYVSFIVENHEFPKLPETGKAVGIDVGVEKLLVTSDGEFLPNLRPYERALKKVRRLHKELSRKRYLSHNWFRAKIKLARAYEHLANLRRDLYMKLGRYFAEHYDAVVMEDISVKQLIGKSGRRMRMRLHDVAFHELKEMVKYQMEKYGKKVVLVDPRDSSKTCARCGYVKDDLTLSDRVFSCSKCGWTVDRDYNSALNHLKHAGWESPVVPVELRPLPITMGKAGRGSGKPLKDGVAHYNNCMTNEWGRRDLNPGSPTFRMIGAIAPRGSCPRPVSFFQARLRPLWFLVP